MLRPLCLALAVFVAGCDGGSPESALVGGVTVVDMPPGGATYVSLRALAAGGSAVLSAEVAGTIDWDLSFDGTEVRLNGGSSGPGVAVGVVVVEPFPDIVDALREDRVYRRDGDSPCAAGPPRVVCAGSLLGTSGGALVPVLGRVLLLRLADGQGYAKVRVDAVTDGPGGEPRLTLRYVVNPEGPTLAE